jgi:hypothetical protein
MHQADSRNVPLVYEGTRISAKNEMLSLTDMWKAAGSPNNREPFNWARKEGAPFIEAVVVTHNLTGSQVMNMKSGKGGGTWAHWQIAMAYAKYLDPKFHMWCNTIVRSHMEGRPTVGHVPEELERTLGICKMLSHKVTEIERAIPILIGQTVEAALASDPRRAVLDFVSVRQLLDETKALQKGRNRLNRKIGREMKDRAAASATMGRRQCPHSNVWLYPRELAKTYMLERGNTLVREHNDAVKGQGILKLVRKPTDEPRPL